MAALSSFRFFHGLLESAAGLGTAGDYVALDRVVIGGQYLQVIGAKIGAWRFCRQTRQRQNGIAPTNKHGNRGIGSRQSNGSPRAAGAAGRA